MLKVRLDKQVHYLRLSERSISLDELKERVRDKFKVCPSVFYLTYKDEEGDDIIISRQDDLITAFQLAMPIRSDKLENILKLVIVQDEQAINLSKRDESLSVQLDSAGLNEVDSFELLHSSQSSDFQELNEQLNVSEESEQVSFEEGVENKEISNIVRDNLNKLSERIIENVLVQTENTIVSDEVDAYLINMYEKIQKDMEFQKKEVQQQKKSMQKIKFQQKQQRELSSMIEKSLHKLLPGFMKEVAEKTIRSVKQLLKEEQQHASKCKCFSSRYD